MDFNQNPSYNDDELDDVLSMGCDDEATDFLLGQREEMLDSYQRKANFLSELEELKREISSLKSDLKLEKEAELEKFRREEESVLLEFINDCENMLLRKRQKGVAKLKVKRVILPSDLPYLSETDYKKVVHLMASGNAILDMDTLPRDFLSACHLLQDSLPEIDFHLPPRQKSPPWEQSSFHRMNIPQTDGPPVIHVSFLAKGRKNYELSQYFLSKHKPIESISCLMAAAYYQHPQAKPRLQMILRQIRLKALLWDENEEVPPLSKKAMLLQAHCQLTGIGRLQNEKFASQSYRHLAKDYDNREAQLSLAMCYFDGIGVKQNDKLGYTWLKKASAQGSDTATIELALCYLYGRGVTENMKKVISLLEPLAEKKILFACFLVGLFYTYGLGVEQDMEKGTMYSDLAPQFNIQDLGGPLRRKIMMLLDSL